MKKIEAILRPEMFDFFKDTLTEKGYGGMSVVEIKGHGNQKGVSDVCRGKRYRVTCCQKQKIELIVSYNAVKQVIQTIIDVSLISVAYQTGSWSVMQ
jgi:nitrogen regulatory protein P-II 1